MHRLSSGWSSLDIFNSRSRGKSESCPASKCITGRRLRMFPGFSTRLGIELLVVLEVERKYSDMRLQSAELCPLVLLY